MSKKGATGFNLSDLFDSISGGNNNFLGANLGIETAVQSPVMENNILTINIKNIHNIPLDAFRRKIFSKHIDHEVKVIKLTNCTFDNSGNTQCNLQEISQRIPKGVKIILENTKLPLSVSHALNSVGVQIADNSNPHILGTIDDTNDNSGSTTVAQTDLRAARLKYFDNKDKHPSTSDKQNTTISSSTELKNTNSGVHQDNKHSEISTIQSQRSINEKSIQDVLKLAEQIAPLALEEMLSKLRQKDHDKILEQLEHNNKITKETKIELVLKAMQYDTSNLHNEFFEKAISLVYNLPEDQTHHTKSSNNTTTTSTSELSASTSVSGYQDNLSTQKYDVATQKENLKYIASSMDKVMLELTSTVTPQLDTQIRSVLQLNEHRESLSVAETNQLDVLLNGLVVTEHFEYFA